MVFYKLRKFKGSDLFVVLDLARHKEIDPDAEHKYESQRYDHFDCLAQN